MKHMKHRESRYQPSVEELSNMSTDVLALLAKAEAKALLNQKQTAVARLLDELASRLLRTS